MVRNILNLISVNIHTIAALKMQGIGLALLAGLSIDKKYLKEYRCPNDNKLLAKGFLKDSGSVLEAKCRSCGQISYFQGEDIDILITRKELLKKGQIPDTE